MLDELRLPSCAVTNAAVFGYCPELPAAFWRPGDEIVAHGRTNSERQSELDESADTKLIAAKMLKPYRRATEGVARPVDFGKRRHA